MPSVETQIRELARYLDTEFTDVGVEELTPPDTARPIGPRALDDLSSRRPPNWVAAVGAAVLVLFALGGSVWLLRGDSPEVADEPAATTGPVTPPRDITVGWSKVDSSFGGLAVTLGGPGLVTVGADCSRKVDGNSVCEPGAWVSPDAINWQRAPSGTDVFDTFDPVSGVVDVAAGPTGVVAVGLCLGFSTDACDAGLWFSPDGMTWEPVGLPEDVFETCPTSNAFDCSLEAVVAGGPGFVVSGRDRSGPGVWASENGRDWSRATGPNTFPQDAGSATGFNKGLVVLESRIFAIFDLVGSDVGTAIWTSLDGINWERVPDPDGALAAGMMSEPVAWEGGLAARGRVWSDAKSPDVLWTSPDGLTWSYARLSAPDDGATYGAVVADGPGLIVAGQDLEEDPDGEPVGGTAGYFWTSMDGLTWHRHTADPDVFDEGMSINEFIWHKGVLVGIGGSGIYLWSP